MDCTLCVVAPSQSERFWLQDRSLLSRLLGKLAELRDAPDPPFSRIFLLRHSQRTLTIPGRLSPVTAALSLSEDWWRSWNAEPEWGRGGELWDAAAACESQLPAGTGPLCLVSPCFPLLRASKIDETMRVFREIPGLTVTGSGFRTWEPLRADGAPFVAAKQEGYAYVDACLCLRRPAATVPRVFSPTVSLIDLRLDEALDIRVQEQASLLTAYAKEYA